MMDRPIRLIILCLISMGWTIAYSDGQNDSLGCIAGRVLDARSCKPVAGATVKVQLERSRPIQDARKQLCAQTDANGRYEVGTYLGFARDEVDMGRVLESSVAGLLGGVFSGGFTKKTRTVKQGGIALEVSKDGYKPFVGFVEFQDVSAESFSAVCQSILLAPKDASGVSRLNRSDDLATIREVHIPDSVVLSARDTKVPVTATVELHPSIAAQCVVCVEACLELAPKTQFRSASLLDNGKVGDGAAKDGVYGGTLVLNSGPQTDVNVLCVTVAVKRGYSSVATCSVRIPCSPDESGLADAEHLMRAVASQQSATEKTAAQDQELLSLYRGVLTNRPASLAATLETARRLMGGSKYDDAIEVLEAAPAAVRSSRDLDTLYVRALAMAGRDEEVKACTASLKTNGEDERRYWQAAVALRTGDMATAEKLFPILRTALGTGENRRWCIEYQLKLAAGKPDKALGCYLDAFDLGYAGAVQQPLEVAKAAAQCALEALKSKDPGERKRGDRLLLLAVDDWMRCDRPGVLRQLEQALAEKHPAVIPLVRELNLLAFYSLGVGSLDVAKQAAQKSLAFNGPSPENCYVIAQVEERAQQQRALTPWLAKLLGTVSDGDCTRLAQELEAQGHSDLAILAYQRATNTATSTKFRCALQLASALARQGYADSALEAFAAAADAGRSWTSVSDAPGSPATTMRLPAAYTYDKSGHPTVTKYEQVKVAPIYTRPSSYVCSGYAAPLAQECFYIAEFGVGRLGASTEPTKEQTEYVGSAYDLVLGRALVRCGAAKVGLTFLERAGRNLPDSVEVAMALAEAHLCLGDRKAAAESVQAALKLAPKDEELAQMLSVLTAGR